MPHAERKIALVAGQSKVPALTLARENQQRLAAIILRMLAAFRNFQMSPDEARTLLDSYCKALGEFPIEAIVEAETRFLRGIVDGHDVRFPPTPPQWAVEARKCHYKMLPERKLIVVEEAKLSPEERANVRVLFEDLVQKMIQLHGHPKKHHHSKRPATMSPEEALETSKYDTSGISLSPEVIGPH